MDSQRPRLDCFLQGFKQSRIIFTLENCDICTIYRRPSEADDTIQHLGSINTPCKAGQNSGKNGLSRARSRDPFFIKNRNRREYLLEGIRNGSAEKLRISYSVFSVDKIQEPTFVKKRSPRVAFPCYRLRRDQATGFRNDRNPIRALQELSLDKEVFLSKRLFVHGREMDPHGPEFFNLDRCQHSGLETSIKDARIKRILDQTTLDQFQLETFKKSTAASPGGVMLIQGPPGICKTNATIPVVLSHAAIGIKFLIAAG
ncbi:P-loop containing nucleoside triphosphate hydrolase protein [Penicillium cosmopolitanum]|uniref:P-loop containing nucleoside triphosphate hydrolase protein n=1 Tax=Penicillium cosmopolitanum TaxID=1131564 RepID=A0A9W9VGL1_9EURO|nr:P-loop containing nucleoside triphosphate hydrolase protein [Penicillium cosmopolitanum]KAJ5378611.1 P-loop containing nucleoside triphosphate hydrolase protein [Penicillium cosmopolitanum]